jgi:hypothetical protein
VRANDDIFGGPHAELITAAFEFDLLARPYVYRNTPLDLEPQLDVLEIVETHRRGWLVKSPYDIPDVVSQMRRKASAVSKCETLILIDHDRGQMYRMPGRTQKEYWDECRMFALEMGNYYPTWKVIPSSAIESIAPIT